MDRQPYTICVLCYGDFFELHKRCIHSILFHTQPEGYELRIGLNNVGKETYDYVMGPVQKVLGEQFVVFNSEKNIKKYPMMRKMFHSEDAPIKSPWVIWFDDDSYVESTEWIQDLEKKILREPGAMFGKKYFIHLDGNQPKWMEEARWYRGRPIQMDTKKGRLKVDFITGGWWAMPRHWIANLDWPDPRILHNGGDVALGEALRQNNGMLINHYSGIQIDKADRRGYSEKPAGYHEA